MNDEEKGKENETAGVTVAKYIICKIINKIL